MSDSFDYDVFLSHSSKDKAVVSDVAERLRKDGLRVWFDAWELKPGDSIQAKIDEGLESSRVLVLFMSGNAFSTDWTQLESHAFRFRDPLNKKRRFIPLRLDDAPIKGPLASLVYINWPPDPKEQEYEKLLEACRRPSNSGTLDRSSVLFHDTPYADDEKLPRREHLRKAGAPPANAVQPLHIAEDRFLQILLSRFTLTRQEGVGGPSFELSVEFDDNTGAIWDQNGKRYLREVLGEDKRDRFQKSLDEFFAGGGTNPHEVDDPEFFFRYASGGTLVTIEFEGSQKPNCYYCLFYREVDPIGWNIANGGSDSRTELLNPHETINRELREELIIADFTKRERYVFPADESKPFDHPAHAAARRLWKRKFPDRDLNALRAVSVDMIPQPGPDSLRIKMGHDKEIKQDGFYLNINGKDFGIEFDGIATIRGLPRHITLLDGEIDGGRLVNCPVGLFEVERFDDRLRRREGNFVPDFFYFGDQRYDDGSEITKVLETHFIDQVRPIRTPREIEELKAAIKADNHLGLCPVTKRIGNRYRERKVRSP